MGNKEGNLLAAGLKVALLVSRFNGFITEKLLKGAQDAFVSYGGDPENVDVIHVPGAFELPLAARRLARMGRYDALVALGAVIRGETPHFEYVSGAAGTGLARVSLEEEIPIGFGVLTTETAEQAMERAGIKGGNKGAEALATAVEMANLLKTLG